MDMVYVKLVDRRGRVLWINGIDAKTWDKSLLDYADSGHREKVSSAFARCVIHGETLSIDAMWYCPITETDEWCRSWMYPTDLEPVAAVIIQSLLPKNYPDFSTADEEILRMLASDMPVKAVAEALDRSESAIDTRIRSLKAKLDANTLHGLVAKARSANLLGR